MSDLAIWHLLTTDDIVEDGDRSTTQRSEEKMAYEELELRVHVWRQKNLSGVFLCYKFPGPVPVGLHEGGSKLFNSDADIDDALKDAHIAPS